MGWTEYHAQKQYKNGKFFIDRKAECDKLFNDSMVTWDDDRKVIGKFEVLKSSMVGSTYYAAVKRTKFATETEPEISSVFAAICLTSTNVKDYYNFAYKDMDESCGPYQCDCPKSILDLLTPTESEFANEWRKQCYENIAAKKNPNSLGRLPVGSKIKYTLPYDTTHRKAGTELILTKVQKAWSNRSYWTDYCYRYSSKMIGDNYEIIQRGEI
jgi:hypothetical protein